MITLDEAFEERAAIIEYEGNLPREEAESLARAFLQKNKDFHTMQHQPNQITLTKIEMEVLTLIRRNGKLLLSAQDAETKKALTRLIKKGLVRLMVTGEAIEKAS